MENQSEKQKSGKKMHTNAHISRVGGFDLTNLKEAEYKFSGSPTTQALKKSFMNAFVDSGGNVAFACRQIGIHRRSYYNWCEKDKEFKRMTEELLEEIIDSVEAHLRNLIQSKDTRATIFFLETKGKKRGYIKTQRNENINSTYEHKPREIPIELTLPADEKEREEMEKRLAHPSPEETKEVPEPSMPDKKETNHTP